MLLTRKHIIHSLVWKYLEHSGTQAQAANFAAFPQKLFQGGRLDA